MYCLAVNSLESIGLKRYEVSNFAKPGFESVHNSWYWLGGEYLGVGPGAHGFFRVRNPENPAANQIAVNELRGKTYARSEVRRGQVQARVQTLEPDSWLRETELLGHGTRKISPLGAEEVLTRILTSSMRTEQGLNEKTCRDLGATLDQLVQHEKCQEFIDSKLLIQDPSGIRLSASGIQLADLILPYLLLGCEESSVNEAT